jgi:paraquat-inducible protein A
MKIHRLPLVAGPFSAYCIRCRALIAEPMSEAANSQRTAAAALAALILYVPAVSLPILEIEQLGHRHSSSLLVGTWELIRHGSWFVGGVVLGFPVILPVIKPLLLLELSLLGMLSRQHRAITYRVTEIVGKWSMMDVLLLAFMVMLVKLGSLVQFRMGPAVFAFILCVVMSMVASICFDPHSIWNDE